MRFEYGLALLEFALGYVRPRDFEILAALCFSANEVGRCEFVQADLAGGLRCTRQTIGLSLASLESARLLTKSVSRGGRGSGDTTVVTLSWDPGMFREGTGDWENHLADEPLAPAKKRTRKSREKSATKSARRSIKPKR